jgi:hypothetical protein
MHWRRNPDARKTTLPLYCGASTRGRELVTLEDASSTLRPSRQCAAAAGIEGRPMLRCCWSTKAAPPFVDDWPNDKQHMTKAKPSSTASNCRN